MARLKDKQHEAPSKTLLTGFVPGKEPMEMLIRALSTRISRDAHGFVSLGLLC
jgi:hypothetical protein